MSSLGCKVREIARTGRAEAAERRQHQKLCRCVILELKSADNVSGHSSDEARELKTQCTCYTRIDLSIAMCACASAEKKIIIALRSRETK